MRSDFGMLVARTIVGGAMVIDKANHVTLHRSLSEPAFAAQVCQVIESFLARLLGARVTEHCERAPGRPRCCFEIEPGRTRAA